ncbi:hypothetical protein DY000_02031588 [Brassica cretica]|uniref:Aspartic peptidase DDI1-type domain-containing protein n=1 Tax=Brassica cretica TaxID=69181 RepID=A0ABQ7DXE0_BRACR|nr:hypothetical protein DY000_02031588 [Brassica cretica]
MRKRITLKKKSDPGQFAISCTVKGIEFPHALCDTGVSVSIIPRVMAGHLGLQVEPSKELFTFVDCSQRNSGGTVRDLEVQVGNALVLVDFHVLDIKLNWNSSLLLGRAFLATVEAICNLQTNQLCLMLIDPHVHYNFIPVKKPHTSPEESMIQESLQHATMEQNTRHNTRREESVDISLDNWENDYYNPIMAVNDATPETREDLYDEEYKRKDKDEYAVYRDEQGCTRDVDGHIINVCKADIRKLMERASRDEHNYICFPEHASSFTQTKLVPEIYTKNKINEMFYGVRGAQEKNEGDFQMKLDGVYYPLNDIISWLTTCMEEMRQDIAKIQRAADKHRSPSIDRHHSESIDRNNPTSIDDDPKNSHPMKSQPDFHTRAEID